MKTDTIKTLLIIGLFLCIMGVICTSCAKQNPDPCGCLAQYKKDSNAKTLADCQQNCKH